MIQYQLVLGRCSPSCGNLSEKQTVAASDHARTPADLATRLVGHGSMQAWSITKQNEASTYATSNCVYFTMRHFPICRHGHVRYMRTSSTSIYQRITLASYSTFACIKVMVSAPEEIQGGKI